MSNNRTVLFKYLTILSVNYTSIRIKKEKSKQVLIPFYKQRGKKRFYPNECLVLHAHFTGVPLSYFHVNQSKSYQSQNRVSSSAPGLNFPECSNSNTYALICPCSHNSNKNILTYIHRYKSTSLKIYIHPLSNMFGCGWCLFQ